MMRIAGMRRLAVLGTLAAGTLALGACATPAAHSPAPRHDPVVGSLLTTTYPVTVLDDGDGAELCLGAVAMSLPPQCGGPSLVGWDWNAYTGQYEEMSGVRWGQFIVTGTYDVETGEFAPAEVVSGEGFEWPDASMPDSSMPDFSTPCAEPVDGWRVEDESKATFDSMNAVFGRAQRLPGYATAWMDQSPNPASGQEATPEKEYAMNDPLLTIVNVRVTGDPAAAEAELRKVWGGMLCVTTADRTEAELTSIQNEIMETTPGVLTSGANGMAGLVDVGVIYDDGDLQAELDDKYGPGLVKVTSALVPVA